MSSNARMFCQLVISLALILPFWGLVWCLFFKAASIDPSVRDTVNQVTGALIGTFLLAAGFWLGTSLSSASKDAVIAQATKGNPT